MSVEHEGLGNKIWEAAEDWFAADELFGVGQKGHQFNEKILEAEKNCDDVIDNGQDVIERAISDIAVKQGLKVASNDFLYDQRHMGGALFMRLTRFCVNDPQFGMIDLLEQASSNLDAIGKRELSNRGRIEATVNLVETIAEVYLTEAVNLKNGAGSKIPSRPEGRYDPPGR